MARPQNLASEKASVSQESRSHSHRRCRFPGLVFWRHFFKEACDVRRTWQPPRPWSPCPSFRQAAMLRRGNESQCKEYSFVTAEACDFCQVVSQMSSACYDKAPSRISNTRKSAELVLLEELPATAPLELLLKDGLGEADVDQPCAQTEEC